MPVDTQPRIVQSPCCPVTSWGNSWNRQHTQKSCALCVLHRNNLPGKQEGMIISQYLAPKPHSLRLFLCSSEWVIHFSPHEVTFCLRNYELPGAYFLIQPCKEGTLPQIHTEKHYMLSAALLKNRRDLNQAKADIQEVTLCIPGWESNSPLEETLEKGCIIP